MRRDKKERPGEKGEIWGRDGRLGDLPGVPKVSALYYFELIGIGHPTDRITPLLLTWAPSCLQVILGPSDGTHPSAPPGPS